MGTRTGSDALVALYTDPCYGIRQVYPDAERPLSEGGTIDLEYDMIYAILAVFAYLRLQCSHSPWAEWTSAKDIYSPRNLRELAAGYPSSQGPYSKSTDVRLPVHSENYLGGTHHSGYRIAAYREPQGLPQG